MDPCNKQCESEVQRIIHMKKISNRMLDDFNDSKNIIKSYIPTVNALARIEIPDNKSIS